MFVTTTHLVLLSACFYGTSSSDENDIFFVEKPSALPHGFIFGTSTASYQVEGAWNVSGKGVNIWDEVTHRDPSYIIDKSNGDFRMYRFSISWARILPEGTTNHINVLGINYYHDVIDELIQHGITPMVTMFHWDLPQKLQEKGGWLNPKMADYFEDYADLLFSSFGDKVKWWITINEPLMIVDGYGSTDMAPALNMTGVGDYLAAHNLLRAHAKAYKLYRSQYCRQKGRISLSLNVMGAFPKDETNEEDLRAVERFMQFQVGWFAHPIFSTYGDYPAVMRNTVDTNSMREGRNTSRLPYFSEEEISEIKGSADFFALNHYSSRLYTTGKVGRRPSWSRDTEVVGSINASWPSGKSSWLKVVPEGIRQNLKWINDEYHAPEIFVTENGFSDYNVIDDQERINYLRGYLSEMEKAIHEDGIKAIGYTVWSILDNFEWRAGYTERFGLVHVNFTDPRRKRTPKASANFMKEYIRNNS